MNKDIDTIEPLYAIVAGNFVNLERIWLLEEPLRHPHAPWSHVSIVILV